MRRFWIVDHMIFGDCCLEVSVVVSLHRALQKTAIIHISLLISSIKINYNLNQRFHSQKNKKPCHHSSLI